MHLDWKQPNGRTKERACRVALLKLEQLGIVSLPPRVVARGGRPPVVYPDNESSSRPIVTSMPQSVCCQLVSCERESRLWNSLIANHHYLGLTTPVGRLLRYLVYGDEELLGAISFGESAWNITVRNQILETIGIQKEAIQDAVFANNRFLILPNVQVPNLASHVLAKSVRMAAEDWESRFGTLPLVVETFVDPRRFEGTCYRAANWVLIGSTKGFAKSGARHINEGAPKLMFLRGLTSQCHGRIQHAVTTRTARAA